MSGSILPLASLFSPVRLEADHIIWAMTLGAMSAEELDAATDHSWAERREMAKSEVARRAEVEHAGE